MSDPALDPLASCKTATPAYAWYALAVMLVAYVLSFVDRQLLNLLVEPIKRDLHLTDFQMSLLQGFAFAVFLSFTSIPLGRAIDTRRRTAVLAIGAGLWSAATMSCALAGSFLRLLVARAGVGAGESVMTPSALSLIGDFFPPKRMGLATGIYALGLHVGSGLALIFSAVVIAWVARLTIALPIFGALHGWQFIFIVVGSCGFPVALWVASLKEPPRGRYARSPGRILSLKEVASVFRINGAAITYANLGVAFSAMATYGTGAWLPSYFIRHFAWTAVHVGWSYGPLVIATGIPGVLAAGVLGDALATRMPGARLRIMGACALCAAPLAAAAPLMANPNLALWFFAAANFFAAAAIGSGPALLQELAPPAMRGVTHAIALFTVNTIALGFGPSAIAVVTDWVLHDERQLGTSLAVVPPALLLFSALIAFAGTSTVVRSLAHIKKL